ncbi:unnamed protein product [Penicillium salamii]|uniref:Uncharacterized protein n=1 Tax=Penicillium salamii TaxID=1612424 RepID=A0A9W4J0K8_9EURO|nr:unnamed protein product [Penicillium salamii]CAG8036571.1 unnamed protein product [Penicillium salamii]CAG8055298.1 unnamed protein product [Penicillium salamii]CAG8202793.1 unnamed protein product [Penicillium salamii]CAG8326104.1 unnamed protein product [Penicillium salamii]
MSLIISLIYYLFLLLLFGYFVVYHFPQMTSSTSNAASANNPDPNDQVEELDHEKFYHHPVWPQRWHHPELTKEAFSKYKQELWFKDAADRPSRRILTQLFPCNLPWGFIIYRTVYTPESEELWPIVLERIAKRLKEGVMSEAKDNESRVEQLMVKSHKNVIISDPHRWNTASIPQIRSHFVEYLRKLNQTGCPDIPRLAACLVVDEKSLNSIVKDEQLGFLGVIDGWYNPEEKYDFASYRGFMRVQLIALWNLYLDFDRNPMWMLCPDYPDGWIPVYPLGVGGTVQDEDGNEYVRRREGSAERGRGRGHW